MSDESKAVVTAPAKGLKILIIGAGIGGLSAAIALRGQGHEVEVMFSEGVFRILSWRCDMYGCG
jgi:monoamine oxidase